MIEPIDIDQIELIKNAPTVTLVLTLKSGKKIRKKMNVVEAFFEINVNPLIGIAYKSARIEGLGDYNMRQWDTSI